MNEAECFDDVGKLNCTAVWCGPGLTKLKRSPEPEEIQT